MPDAREAVVYPWPVLFYDGDCGLCDTTVQLVLRHDRAGHLRFASLQGEPARQLLAAHPELSDLDSMLWVEPSAGDTPPRILSRSDAALRVARYLGGLWRLALVGTVIPRPLRDRMYDIVARHRHRLMGPPGQCVVPPPDARHRFLDDGGASTPGNRLG